MKEKIELWASLYSWEDLNSDQQILVGNEYGKEAYEKLHQKLISFKKLDRPSDDVTAKILAIPQKKKNRILPFISGIAAALLIGFFIGSLSFPKIVEIKEKVSDRDTIFKTQIDTVFIAQMDTIIQEKIKYKKVVKTEYVKDEIVVNDCYSTPTNLSPDYKVPVPKYEVPLPKNDFSYNEEEFVVHVDQEYSDILKR
ncbi:MAG: hypothetical protein R2799_12150 [Crocinitomicaceae bacterium]